MTLTRLSDGFFRAIFRTFLLRPGAPKFRQVARLCYIVIVPYTAGRYKWAAQPKNIN